MGALNGNENWSATGCLIYNISINTALNNNGIFGVYYASAGRTGTAKNCTFYLPAATYPLPIIVTGGTAGTLNFQNNIFYTGTARSFGGAVGTFNNNSTYNFTSVPAGTNNITADPLFVDAANANFNLRPSSPCLDTGILI